MQPIALRLERSVDFLEKLELLRDFSGDADLGAAEEQDVIQREILDLELSEVDSEIQRICDLAA
ncbi:MAG: hypothetical protein JNK87_02975 [Bryobacterales bacterium]|nr:hypothetical protein [Bryobacterales bacterium]